jgi:hypothetical protein
MGFLPKDYERPSTGNDRYFRLEDGDTKKIRILGSFEDGTGIMGWQGWKTDEEGNRKPIRSIEDEKGTLQGQCDPGEKLKWFWALPLYDYSREMLIVWEITQRTIQDRILALANDEDFGNPNHYDLKIQRMGTGMETKYFINALPPTEFSKEVQSVIDTELIHIKMKELFTGGDPFDGIPF